jgi:hypothetical protein
MSQEEKGGLIGKYQGRRNATKVITEMAYQPEVYCPRSSQARAVVASWRADPHFPRRIYTRDFLNFTLRHQRRATLAERHVAGDIWQRYMHWRHAQAKFAA